MNAVCSISVSRSTPTLKSSWNEIHLGAPPWLSRLSIRLQLRSWSHGSWVRALRQPQSLEPASDSVSPSLSAPPPLILYLSLYLSLSLSLKRKWPFKKIYKKKEIHLHTRDTSVWPGTGDGSKAMSGWGRLPRPCPIPPFHARNIFPSQRAAQPTFQWLRFYVVDNHLQTSL